MNDRGMTNHPEKTKTGAAAPGDSSGGNSSAILNEAADILRRYYGADMESLFVERVVVGVFFTGVQLSNGCGGIAYTPPETVRRASRHILRGDASSIHGMRAMPVVAGNVPGPFAQIIRLATVNALSARLFQEGYDGLEEGNDLSGVSQLFAGRRICMVGAIVPLLKRIKELGAAEVQVIDRKKQSRSEVERIRGIFLPQEQTAEALARCETAVFTGAAVANGTIEHLLSLVPEGVAVAVVGPTAGFVPDPLFRRGVALVGTSVVTDSDAALDIIAEGGGAYRLFGRCVRKINLLNRRRIEKLKG